MAARRGFLTGVVGLGAVVGLARATEGPLWHQDAFAATAPSGPPTTTLPLFDRYQVDLVLSRHEHDYERAYPVRGYDRGAHGTVVSPNPDQTAGETIDTRRPSVATTETVSYYGVPAWDTSRGTVFLVLGGGGTNGPSNVYGTDAAAPSKRAGPAD